MKQSLAALALALAASLGWAQTQTALPDEPVFTAVSTVSPNAVAALANPNTNSVFIDQSGGTPTVNILQDGAGNKAGTAANPVYLRGINQNVQVNQTGDQNTLALSVKNPDTGQAVGATVQIRQTGDSNNVDLACGVGKASDGVTNLTGCRSADINVKLVGNNNAFQFRGTGDTLSTQFDVSGNGNQFSIDAIGNDHSQTVKMLGDNNTMNITQTSTLGSSVWVDSWGNGNTFNISQTGPVSSVVNLKNVSTSGTFNVVQRN